MLRIKKVMHQNVKCGHGGRVEPVDEALVDETPIGLYTKLRKTRTFEMLHFGKLLNLAHVGP